MFFKFYLHMPLLFHIKEYLSFKKKHIYHSKRNWSHFRLPKFCHSSIYVITIVRFGYTPIQNLSSFPQQTSMYFREVISFDHFVIISLRALFWMIMSATEKILNFTAAVTQRTRQLESTLILRRYYVDTSKTKFRPISMSFPCTFSM